MTDTNAIGFPIHREPKPKDRRAILHIAGEDNPALDQLCTRCHCVISPKGNVGWQPGAVIVSSGRGRWSVLRPEDASNPNIHRLCGRRR